jgi:hypothetical protein
MMRLFYKIFQVSLIVLLGIGFALAQDLPEGWLNEDIGDDNTDEGSAMFANDTFYVSGGGTDIWGPSDQFHFVYRTFEGDGYIQAKVDSLVAGNTNNWCKAGVMMREEISGGSPHAMTVNTRDFSVEMQQRFLFDENMGSNVYNTRPDETLTFANCGHRWNIWVKLERVGQEITGFYSLDTLVEEGTGARIWNEIAVKELDEFSSSVYAGVMVTSHAKGSLTDAIFTEVEYGDFTSGITEELPDMVVKDFVLHENYPNPFNPQTTIPYEVNKAGAVKITIYDMLGREITLLVNKFHSPGTYTATWNAGSAVSSGIYFYRLESGNYQSQMMKMVMIK